MENIDGNMDNNMNNLENNINNSENHSNNSENNTSNSENIIDYLEVLPLHHNDIYSEACCDLINSEWKRSETARMISLKKSCDTFPTSLVMVRNKIEVVGHSRLSAIPSIPFSCFVESVVVDKDHRGKGWGKYLMLETEEYARSCGVQEIYLSAIPPVPAFYAKLGYVVCEPVCIFGGPTPTNVDESPRSSPTTVTPTPTLGLPPAEFSPYSRFRKKQKVYMKKQLYEMEL